MTRGAAYEITQADQSKLKSEKNTGRFLPGLSKKKRPPTVRGLFARLENDCAILFQVGKKIAREIVL